ncbi:unnamed protein product [Durusdinium trenchii]|uniref:Nitronate monooxygenase domain-containing protein n=1 Tax=Durusdinium trenchii TaxID=1381693 RepID=A0ABP0QKX2_9DINO
MACCGAGTSAPSGGEKDDFDEIKPGVTFDGVLSMEDLQSSDALIEVLHHEDLRLIHGTYLQWLHEEQRAFPRRQDIEEKAFVSSLELEQWRLNKNEMQSRVRIICLSHVWECDQHPDPAGYQLEVLAKSQHWPASLSWYFIDFMSVSHLNRKDSMESLCPKYIYALYSHEKTFTYQITGFTPAAKFREALKSEVRAAYAFQDFSVIQGPTRLKHLILDDTPYLQRGWCLAEAQWSVMRSDPRRLVCLDSIEEHKAPMPPKMFQARVANGALRFRYFLDEEAIIYQQEKAFNQKAQSSTQLRLMKLPATEVLILAEALPFYVRLTKLSLSKCRLSVRVLTALAKGLEEHALRDLDLRDNAMNDASANGIAEIFRTNHHLKRVDLRQNSFSPAGAKAIASGLTDNSHVSELILRENQIQCHGASILAEALRFNDALEFLDVSFNQIRDDGAMAFAIALPDNQSLRTLNLAENLITSACLPSWATYLSSGQCRLQQLRFDGNLIDVDAEAAKVLEDSWHEGQRAGTQHLPSICGLGEIEDRVKQRLDRTWNSHASGPSSAAAAYVEFCRRPVLLAAMPCLPEACFYFASLQAEPSWDSPAGWVIAGALLVTFIVVCFHFVLELNSNARKACSSLALHLDLASALGAVIAALANALWTLPLCDTIPEAAACYSLSFVGLFALVLQQVARCQGRGRPKPWCNGPDPDAAPTHQQTNADHEDAWFLEDVRPFEGPFVPLSVRPAMVLKTKLTEALGIKHPIIQGGMHYVGYAELAAAVSNAGGLGIITALTVAQPPRGKEALRDEIRKCRQLTDKPFGVNITLLPVGVPPDFDGIVQVLIEEKVKVIETAGRNPEKVIKKCKEAGMFVIHKCVAVRHAQTAAKMGADMISMDGFDCGGHPGEEDVGNWVLLAQASQELKIPFVASGGTATGVQLAAALAMGAEGVNMGTRFMATKEAPILQPIKDTMVKAKVTDTTHIFRTMGNTERVYKNKTVKEAGDMRSCGRQTLRLTNMI